MKKLLILALCPVFCFSAGFAIAEDAIVTATVNLRAGPGVRYAVRAVVPAMQHLFVHSCSANWCQVNFGNRIGWTSANYIAFATGEQAYRSYNPARTTFNIVVGDDRWHNGYWGDPYWHGSYYGYRPYYRWHHHNRPSPRYVIPSAPATRPGRVIPSTPATRSSAIIPSTPAIGPSTIPSTPAKRPGRVIPSAPATRSSVIIPSTPAIGSTTISSQR